MTARGFMKGHPLVCLLVAALLPVYAHAGSGCDTNAQKRVLKGKQPIAGQLYAILRDRHMGPWDDKFELETFTYIGDAHTKANWTYRIGYLDTEWQAPDESRCGTTARLYIFDDHNRPLHGFSIFVDSRKIKIKGATLIFPFDSKRGNILNLENGIPQQVLLDGEFVPDNLPRDKKTKHTLNPSTASISPTASPAPDPGTAPP